MSDFRLLINGRFVQGAGTLDVINPATGRTLMAAVMATIVIRASGSRFTPPARITRPGGSRDGALREPGFP